MKVLYVSHFGGLGGAERTLLDLVAALARRGVEPILACPAGGALAQRAKQAGVPVLPLPDVPRERPRRARDGLRLGLRVAHGNAVVAAILRRTRALLVHANTTFAQLLAGPAAKARGVRNVWHWRDFHDLPVLHRALGWSADAVVAVSPAMREFALAQLGSRANVVHVSNGIAELPPARGGEREVVRALARAGTDDLLVVCAGQSVPRKGFEVLLRAMKDPRVRRARLKALLVCESHDAAAEGHTRALRALLEAFGCAEWVTIVPGRPEIAPVLRAADIVAVPSAREPFGRIAVEAMLAERPVVASAVDGLVDIVTHEHSGLHVRPGDVAGLTESLLRLAGDAALRASLGRAGRCAARERFSDDVMAECVLSVYRGVFAAG